MKVDWQIEALALDKLIEIGVKRLRRFGFINVTPENILSDEVYRYFLLRDTKILKGKNKELDKQIDFFTKAIMDEDK